MATPEEIASQPGESPDLRLIQGGLALDQTVEVKPLLPEPFSEFAMTLDEDAWAGMSAEQLMKIRERINDYRGNLASLIHSLQQEFDAALTKEIWINGFIRDRQ